MSSLQHFRLPQRVRGTLGTRGVWTNPSPVLLIVEAEGLPGAFSHFYNTKPAIPVRSIHIFFGERRYLFSPYISLYLLIYV